MAVDSKKEKDLEKTHNATERAGHTVERAAKLAKAGVPHSVIALQLTEGSSSGQKYVASEVKTLVKIHNDNTSKPNINTKQYKALLKDQHMENARKISREAIEKAQRVPTKETDD